MTVKNMINDLTCDVINKLQIKLYNISGRFIPGTIRCRFLHIAVYRLEGRPPSLNRQTISGNITLGHGLKKKKQYLVSHDVNNTELCVPARMRWFPRTTVQAISASFALRRPAPRHLSSRWISSACMRICFASPKGGPADFVETCCPPRARCIDHKEPPAGSKTSDLWNHSIFNLS